MINYLAWFWAVVMFGLFWVYLHKKKLGWNDKKITKWLALLVPTILLIDAACFNLSRVICAAAGWIYG
nr:hypothetical protein [Candidatus Sigynarchaeota archaeon]